MHKHTARLPACSAVVGIADAAETLDNRAPSRRYGRIGDLVLDVVGGTDLAYLASLWAMAN